MTVTAEDLMREIQSLRNSHNPPSDREYPVYRPENTERLRTMAQGMTFGGADEAEAWLRSKTTGEDYDEALKDVRDRLKRYRSEHGGEALFMEVAGASLPAIVAAVMSGGTASSGVFPTLARVAGAGAAGGGAYSFLAGEGGEGTLTEQMVNRAVDVPVGMVTGVAGAGAGYAGGKAITSAAGGLFDWLSRKAGGASSRRVEEEIRRVAADSGLTPEEVIQRVESGELMAEMTPMLSSVARQYLAESRGAAQTLGTAFKGRPDRLRSETMEYLQDTMTGSPDENVLMATRKGIDEQKALESAEYNRVFESAPPLSDDLVGDLADALRRVPDAGKEVKKIYRAKTGEDPFFSIKDGEVTFDRAPTLREAEIIRRGIKDVADRQYRRGSGNVGSAIKDVEQGVRGAIDRTSNDLASVRNRWSSIETARDAFEAGRKALSRSPDEVALEWDAVTKKGEGAISAYRAGVVDAFRRKASTGGRKSMPSNMVDPETKEGRVLRTIFPEDQLDTLLNRAGRAANSQSASNKIFGQSETAVTAGRSRQTATDTGMIEGIAEAATGNPFAAIRLAGQAIKAMRPSLSDREVQSLAKLMVEQDPGVMRRALTDSTAIAQVNQLAQSVLERGGTAGMVTGSVAGPATQGIIVGPR